MEHAALVSSKAALTSARTGTDAYQVFSAKTLPRELVSQHLAKQTVLEMQPDTRNQQNRHNRDSRGSSLLWICAMLVSADSSSEPIESLEAGSVIVFKGW